MDPEKRSERVWTAIEAVARQDGTPVGLRHLCLACAASLAVDGVGLTLLSRAPGEREVVCATDPRSEDVEELQFTLGEGPGMDALNGAGTVRVADLAGTEAARRWPMFSRAAVKLGVGAMFAVPVTAGAASIGVLDIFRRTSGTLSADDIGDAFAFADAALVIALDRRGGIDSRVRHSLDDLFTERRAEIHQAAGMVSVQLRASVSDALARLRAYAYAHDRKLSDVAADVVNRKLRFSRDEGTDLDGGRAG